MAVEYFNTARSRLENAISKKPENAQLHSSLGIAYAGLGLREKAIREAERGAELTPANEESWRGKYRLEDLARVNVMIGKYDEAIDQIKYLLSVHGRLSIHLLKLDPAWKPLRELPEFKKLVETGK